MRYLQLVIFILSILCFQFAQYMSVFVLVFFHMFWLIFTKQERFFGWIIILWHVSGLLYLYGHRLMDLLPYKHDQIRILSELLLIITIIPLMYVGHKFKEKFILVNTTVNWSEKQLVATFFHNRLYISNAFLVIMGVIVSLIAFFPFLISRNLEFSFSFLLFLFLFSILNGLLEELLWRGIILSAMLKIVNIGTAIIFSAISFGASQIMYGYPLQICLFYIVAGILLAWITMRSESFITAAIWHSVINMLLIITGFISFYEL